MDTIKNLLSKARRTNKHAAWRKTYAEEIAEIQSRATAETSHRSTAA